jgi:hypothetical protein
LTAAAQLRRNVRPEFPEIVRADTESFRADLKGTAEIEESAILDGRLVLGGLSTGVTKG